MDGESTRPGYVTISIEEEIERVVTIVKRIQENFDIPVSVDTYKAPVLEAAFQAGADMANDIWGDVVKRRIGGTGIPGRHKRGYGMESVDGSGETGTFKSYGAVWDTVEETGDAQ